MNNNPSSIIHDAFICEVAALPISLVATPYQEQPDLEQQVCSRYGSQKPVIVYLKQKGGMYKDQLCKWLNTENGHIGYGVLELLADISNRPLQGADLKQMCSELVKLAGKGADLLDQGFDYRETVAAQEVLSYIRKPSFSVEDMEVLGCSVYLNKDGIVKYGFDCPTQDGEPYFVPDNLHKDFNLFALSEVTLPKVKRNGEYVSEKIISTPFNPLFVCFADREKTAGVILRPAMPGFKNVVFSKSEDFTIMKVARWLGGDAIFTSSLFHKSKNKTARYSGYLAALREAEKQEKYKTLKDIWNVKENGKQELITIDIPEGEIKADNIILCKSMQDAVSTYYHLNALAKSYPNSESLKGKSYHVCFSMTDVNYTANQYYKMTGFAHRLYTFFPNDAASVREARMIGKKYREICRAALPDAFADISGHCRRERIYQHTPNSVRDFFLVYKMDKEQAYASDFDINKLFLTCITSALTASPIKHCAKKDKNGETKDDYWEVNAATLWEFMASEGYCRVISDKTSTDKVGKFFHLDFPFYDELDRNSMVSVTRQCLRDFARTIARPDSGDYEKICNTIAKSKEISDKTIDALPVQDIDYRASYNSKLDHFYYRNCALRITPEAITMVPYSQLTFYVNRGEVLPWDFHMPFLGSNVPFTVDENPEYDKKKKEIEEHRLAKTSEGTPLYTAEEIELEEQALTNWARIYRWKFDFRGKPLRDWWPPLKVLRGFANEYWRSERKLRYQGKRLSDREIAVIDAHLANLLFCLGRPLYRYHNGTSYSAPYLMENHIDNEGEAQGGSGKSTFVNTFMACCGYVLCVDAKTLMPSKDITFAFSELVPRHHRVVHIEDIKKGQNMQLFFNYVTSGFTYQKKFVDLVTVPKEEAPGLVISSNYAMKDFTSSTTRRFPIGGFSDRFCGENVLKGQIARSPTALMPDFSSSPEYLSQPSRNQIAYICAIAVQMVMKYDTIINVPTDEAIERMEVAEYGKSFVVWVKEFVQRVEKKQLFGYAFDADTCFWEYKQVLNTSKQREEQYNPSRFQEKAKQYLNNHGYVFNPDSIRHRQADGEDKFERSGYARLTTWHTVVYFGEKEWASDPSIQPKFVRERHNNRLVFFVYKKGDKNVPQSFDELKKTYQQSAWFSVDPEPILDDEGNPVKLTEEEKARWTAFNEWKTGKRKSSGFSGTIPVGGQVFGATPLNEEEQKNQEDLPF